MFTGYQAVLCLCLWESTILVICRTTPTSADSHAQKMQWWYRHAILRRRYLWRLLARLNIRDLERPEFHHLFDYSSRRLELLAPSFPAS